MITLVKLTKEHVLKLVEQKRASRFKGKFGPEQLQILESKDYTYAFVRDDGTPVAIAGITEYWRGRGEVWSIFGDIEPSEFLSVHTITKRFLHTVNFRRIEASVEVGFERGHRWVKSLGFKLDAPLLKSFLPDGEDCSLYSIVREN